MSDDIIRAQLAREFAAANLERAAERFVAVLAVVRQGDASEDSLRGRRTALLEAAVAYCAAHGHPPPAGGA